MIVLSLLFFILLALGLLLMYYAITDVDDGGMWYWASVFIFSLALLPFYSSYTSNVDSLVTIDSNDELIKIYKDRETSLDEHINKINISDKTFSYVNGDTPFASIIEAKTLITKDIADAKIKAYEAKVDILKRSRGYFWWIPVIFK